MIINKTIFLKEMGISSWLVKDKVLPEITKQKNGTEMEQTMTEQLISDIPTWSIVYDDEGSSSNLLKHVELVTHNFGVKVQVLPFNNSIKNSKMIQGQLLICMGDDSGSYFSGEINPVENLREIIFETSNCNEQEIPVIVTYSLRQLSNATTKKVQLWNDLIFARNIYLDTMSDGI
jgi:hypothetical protein